uniref:Uncharacterized protein n=1 Tax=Anguilla anguilla TaxID=7936 RepID=A0A0E9WFM7_ANGAN
MQVIRNSWIWVFSTTDYEKCTIGMYALGFNNANFKETCNANK